ncbi:hypothetical protein WH8501_30325 (plasmid) [Crocosphaera watsonii WH 8501]|uniref:Uncharacterized protein n=2 Tax=Crocosphaera watsonii TaxID=263511 RepID=Q4BYF5_CROWT|nr:hypothetical protein [Crocosphaera watsonii]EAM48930.1 hypothetical protein CwatDRAFT_1327 [Crocosphaera watsonii WH 8501]
MIKAEQVIGVDLDNTIVSYDQLMYRLAVEKGWIDSTTPKSKKIIRDKIRQLPNGDITWQKLQAFTYGSQMANATLIEGVTSFFRRCKQNNIKVYIVSHKTEYGNFDPTKTNLRQAAFTWMKKQNLFDEERLGLSLKSVYFESTRVKKIERISNLSCTDFIDDLEETFKEDSFPDNIRKILYDPHQQYHPFSNVKILSSWLDINEYFFS